MTRSDLIRRLAEDYKDYKDEETGKEYKELSPKAQAEATVSLVLDEITQGLIEDGKVGISGFGTFEVKERAEKECVIPNSGGKRMVVPAYKTAVFKAGKNLKEKVNK